ncbi:recombinase family protein [Paenibacillus alvei]|uniref:Recombinase family protein n=1 Tax=Paenibacillus alvei TaxID=44250 RepID=A0ABT4E5X5_PAEAL|nr:recombinase family protein [Paenibacillus alvei]MCY9529140.1 recombinase family protein [Paenibacillus alvei]
MKEKKKIRAVAYPRYSSDNQREESIVAQMKAIAEYCKNKGYALVGNYPDEAKTATTDRRPNFQKMIKDSDRGLFDVVVVHKLDRFARDRYDSAHYKRKLKRNGVRVESVLEQLDDSPESIILESVLEGMGEYYSKNLSREVLKGMNENAEAGIHVGGRPPYGLLVNKERKYEIDRKRYGAVKMYFVGIDNDLSNEVIADQINAAGYRTQTGRKFTKNSFDGWAFNRKYKGDYTWNVSSAKDDDGKRNTHKKKPIEEQQVIPNAFPAIIEESLFERVYKKMMERKHKPGRMKAKVTYLLTGKIYCGNCGSAYAGNSYRNPKAADKTLLCYYKCSSKCGNTSVRKDDIEDIAKDNLIENCFSSEGTKEILYRVKKLYKQQRHSTQDDVYPIKSELKELSQKINNWIDALGKGIKGLEDKIVEAQHRQEALEEELLRIELIQNTVELPDEAIMRIIEDKKHLLNTADEQQQKEVLQEYVERITIQPSKDINSYNVDITYRVFSGGGEGIRTPVRR